MPAVVHVPQPQERGPSAAIDHSKGSRARKSTAIRAWYKKRFPSCIKAKVDDSPELPRSMPIEEFLFQPGAAALTSRNQMNSSMTNAREAKSRSNDTKEALRDARNAECLIELPLHSKSSIRSRSNTFDMQGVSRNETSSPSTLPTHSQVNDPEMTLMHTNQAGEYLPPPSSSWKARPRPRRANINSPDDFNRFRSDIQGRVELDSQPLAPGRNHAKVPESEDVVFELDYGARPPRASASLARVLLELPVSATSTGGLPKPGAPLPIDPTPIPFISSVVSSDKEIVPDDQGARKFTTFKAYPGVPKRKPVQVSYVPPLLQAGYANGVPPVLRASHTKQLTSQGDKSTNNVLRRESENGRGSRAPYLRPSVDFHEEMFLNSVPSQSILSLPGRRHPKHHESRIPSMDFSTERFGEEVIAMLGNFEEEKKETSAPAAVGGQPQSQSQHRVSPISSMDRRGAIHEMEACGLCRRGGSQAMTARSATREIRPDQNSNPVSPVSPLSSGTAQVSFLEYNWPRFSEMHEYVDPADEYSRRFRDRRREIRRGREQART
ncbi:uncharacterized protein Z518_03881 [Rhinocladiella mackenziei CBS 650.93]|uniref:Uncharacterized protein n=1 Tax=Rhinocladiella mackenziei CBS 650.93 TaxID=1442369 RepID=A0A0D2FUY8_9EURO|nr:uncharacterized protein Z518_03881 [Rhinocladiella mackenziei CBS 650.93]KIX05907.1 hypothetical protein Z518_03881 [Rhinocladiella mackenziei CBS 650.93]